MNTTTGSSNEIRLRGPLKAGDLFSLEQYARQRTDFRSRVIEHKKLRTIPIGPNSTWVFEDRLTIQYQIQEMLRVERIFEPEGIQDELDSYNPLIPDGTNWKATFMIEYPDAEERKAALARMRGIERKCYVQVAGFDRVFAIADEDLERETEEKTSSVHWLRFELTPAMRSAVKSGTQVTVGIDHPAYTHSVNLSAESIASLARDLDCPGQPPLVPPRRPAPVAPPVRHGPRVVELSTFLETRGLGNTARRQHARPALRLSGVPDATGCPPASD
jgi:hypothetical protein